MARTKDCARKSTGNPARKQVNAARKKMKRQSPNSEADEESLRNDRVAGKTFDQEGTSEKENELPHKPQSARTLKVAAQKDHKNTKLPAYDHSIAARDPVLLSDLFSQCIKKQFSNLTTLEQSDMSVASSALRDTTGFEESHVQDNLPKFLETYLPGGKESLSKCDAKASPHTAVVVSAGMRVADLYRTLLVFNNDESKVGKIIAKHMKLTDSIKYMRDTKAGIIITTPKRLQDLIEAGAVSLESLQRIVIDGSYENEKKQTLFNMKEVFQQLVELLNMKKMKPKLGTGEGQIELMVF